MPRAVFFRRAEGYVFGFGFGKIGDDPGGTLQKAHAGFGQPDGTGRAYKQGG